MPVLSPDNWIERDLDLRQVRACLPVFWANSDYRSFTRDIEKDFPVKKIDIDRAFFDFQYFAPFIAKKFKETASSGGIVESDLVRIDKMQKKLETTFKVDFPGRLYLKKDGELPVSGSIKARGGFYEVLCHARDLAIEKGMLSMADSFSKVLSKDLTAFFSQYAIGVGSTGNLGLSIGIMGQALGFKVYVHMSHDAKTWKKELLKKIGVRVIEHQSDYGRAVAHGRQQAENDSRFYFVDDEKSLNLFIGYAVAGQRLFDQLSRQKIVVDEDHPLFVYLPCGVGGGPGGITLGLKHMFLDHVYCFFAEPTHSASMLLGLATKEYEKISVTDVGLDNRTAADGLAVGRPSAFVSRMMASILSGVFTQEDDRLFQYLALLYDTENNYMEPSSHAAMGGPLMLMQTKVGKAFISRNNLQDKMANATHIIWGTGGKMVPEKVRKEEYNKGRQLLAVGEKG